MVPDGDIREQFRFPMTPDGYRTFGGKVPKETRIAFEASGSAYSVSKELKNMGYAYITVAHPKEIAYITKSKKNDKADSLKLAKLHLVGMILESHLLGDDERIFRDLLIQRVKLGKSIASTKNSIIGYLKREDLFDSLPDGADKFPGKRKNAMREIRFGNPRTLVLSMIMDRLAFYEKQTEPLETEIR